MIWRSVICFSLVVRASAAAGATLSGNVEITNSRDAAVRKHKDYTGVVLWVEPAAQPAPALPPRNACKCSSGTSASRRT